MKYRSCALIGPGKGARIRARGPGSLQVRGLPEKETASLVLHLEGSMTEQPIVENGEHLFDACDELVVCYSGAARTFIAIVETGVD